MKTVRVGIIGVGNMGSAHASCIYSGKVAGLKLTAICDTDEKRLDVISTALNGVTAYKNYEDMLDSNTVDAVVIATPHRFHSEIAIKALNSGLHVLVEKPVDITVTAALALNKAARASGKIFAIMFNQRTNELFQKARDIVKSGKLGELKRSVWIITNWYRTQHYYDSGDWRATWSGEGGGVLLNQAPHNLDLWQWICGMPKSITAYCDVAKYHNIEVEDDAAIYARYENGAVGTFLTSTGEYPGTNRLEISGNKGKIVLENGILKWWRLKTDERKACFSSNESFCQIETEYEEITAVSPESAHCGILQNFTNCIIGGESLISPGFDGINELTLSNAAYLSQWLGNKEIELPFDNKLFDEKLKQHIEKSDYEKAAANTSLSENYNKRWQVRW